jgi:predicted enzyme related to lactoylglutathione lyase
VPPRPRPALVACPPARRTMRCRARWAAAPTPRGSRPTATRGHHVDAAGREGPTQWLPYFAVTSVDTIAKKAESLDAKTYLPPTDIPGTGHFAVIADPQGTVRQAVSSSAGEPGAKGALPAQRPETT